MARKKKVTLAKKVEMYRALQAAVDAFDLVKTDCDEDFYIDRIKYAVTALRIDLDTRDISGKFDLGCKGTARLR